MKKITVFLAVLFLISSAVMAEGPQGADQQGAGMAEPELISEDQENGEGVQVQEEETLLIQKRERIRAMNLSHLQSMVQQMQQEMTQEMQALGKNEQKVYQNQNRVRLAVHSLLAMEDLVGGIGPQVREIARNFNNSVQATIRSEERIEKRNMLLKLFAGGDSEAADELEQEIIQNRERVQQLKQLREDCPCSEEVRSMMQEQIQNMEQEQTRLQGVAQAAKKSKGLFGWLWK